MQFPGAITGGVLALLLFFPVPSAQAFSAGADISVHGFIDGRYGIRLQEDRYQRSTSLGEARVQLGLRRDGELVSWQLRTDLVHDEVAQQTDQDFEAGTGPVDLREANLLFFPLPSVDVKLGRQILTWGTGDLLFINDLFPKDWRSFFIGRDVEYLKAPSDALFISFFPAFANIDVAWTPRFDADRYIRGERISYWNPLLGRRAGEDAISDPQLRDRWGHDDELAVRVSKNIASYESAFYTYKGFWKSPVGFNPATLRATFPRLSVYGASLRGGLAGGIATFEAGYYDSRDDRDGTDPAVPNSEWRLLAGYEQQVGHNLSVSVQYYLEAMGDYGGYVNGLPPGSPARNRNRHVLTTRLTRLALSQTLTLSLFVYYSPSDGDGYLRPNINYKLTDAWLLTSGGNLFIGEDDHTFFGQFERNNNLYAGVRYSF
ncbi:MAG: hypothetical protein P1P74_10150 [Desulfuromonadales bacterium]|nr:hypothetical protein [Desulfuromonadales bacterium]